MKKYENIILIILFIILILGGFILALLDIKNNNLIIKNRENYQIFDKCYQIDEHYYCEKTD